MNAKEVLTSNLAKKVYVTAGILFVVLILCDRLIMPWYVNRAGTLEVPSVVGMKYEEATKKLSAVGLKPRQGDTRFDKKYSQGTVIAQNPSPRHKVREGRRVYLTVSGGEQLVDIPSLRGRSFRDAKIALEQRGLTLGDTLYEASNDFPEGTIIAQSVEGGTKVPEGTRVSLAVSQGKGVGRVLVPDVVGKSLIDTETILARSGLKIGKVNYQPSGELLPKTVVAQYPRAGDLVSQDKEIDVFVVQPREKKSTTKILEN